VIPVIAASGEDSDTDCGFMHGERGPETLNCPDFQPFRVVEFLHAVLAGDRRCRGIGLPEVIVATVVLGAGVAGVAAIGLGARRMAHVGAVRTAQTIAAGSVLEGAAIGPGSADLTITADTARSGDNLVEVRVTVGGRGKVGNRTWVTRKLAGP
jgi:hypothetical protein